MSVFNNVVLFCDPVRAIAACKTAQNQNAPMPAERRAERRASSRVVWCNYWALFYIAALVLTRLSSARILHIESKKIDDEEMLS